MYISVFSDELHREVTEILPVYAKWGMKYVDFRGLVHGKPIENQTDEELRALKSQMDSLDLRCGVLQSSLCKVHLPDKEGIAEEMKKLDGLIRAADILDCRLVRSFNFWQYPQDDPHCGELAMRPDELSKVLEMFYPFAKKAHEAGLTVGIENCGQTPDEVIAVLDALNMPDFGMAWDVSNMFELLPEARGDCVDYFEKALKRANMLHVKCRGVLPEVEGRKVPWERVLNGAAALGLDIPVSIETHVPSGAPISPEEATHRCYDYLHRVWPASAPGDLRSALSPTAVFDRPYRDNPVRMAVIGLGMGKNRCTQIRNTCGIELAAVCDINPKRAQTVGEEFGVPYTTDLQTILDDKTIEACYVVVPTGEHCNIARRCLAAGKHTLVTKPMDINHQRCADLIRFAKEQKLLLACDFDLHFRGPLTELKRAVDSGYFGKLKSANMILNIHRTKEYYLENGGWRGTLSMDGGGALSNQGIHEIDRLLTLFGLPSEVSCHTARQTFDIEAEDFGASQWRYENGMVVRISSTTSYPASAWYTRLEVFGDSGAYLLTAGGPEGDHIYWWHGEKWSEESPNPYKKEWNQATDQFAYAIRCNKPVAVPPSHGYLSRLVLDRMYESAAQNGAFVKIKAEDTVL